MENIKEEDIIETPTSEVEEKPEVEEVKTETTPDEQDPLKIELERVQKSSGRTEIEKASYSLKKNAYRVKALGGDPTSILGLDKIEPETETEDEDQKPVTIGMLKKFQQVNAEKTALQQAENIPNETERELVKYHLQNSIKSTGNPSEDLRLAQAIVNSVKNSQILEEQKRKVTPKSHSSSSSANTKEDTEIKGDLTPEEQAFMKPPFNLTKKQILEARGK